MSTPALPHSDNHHAKEKLEKGSRAQREEKKTNNPLFQNLNRKGKEGPISHTKLALAGKNNISSTPDNVRASSPTPGCEAGLDPSPTRQLQGGQAAASHSSAKLSFPLNVIKIISHQLNFRSMPAAFQMAPDRLKSWLRPTMGNVAVPMSLAHLGLPSSHVLA